MSESMYFDPQDFNFTDLVDVVETTPAEIEKSYTKAKEVGPDGGFIDDASDLGDLFGGEENEQEETPDYNDNVSDLVENEKINNDLITIFNDLDDQSLLDFGGETLTKPQVKELLKSKQQIDQQKEFLDLATQRIDQGNEWIEMQLLTKQTSIDKNIAFLEKCLNNPTITGEDYRKFHNDLKAAKDMKTEIEKDAQTIFNTRKEQEETLTRHRFIITDSQMSETYPDWLKWKDQLVNDAISRGIPSQTIMKSWDKAFATALLESFMYRKNKEIAGKKAREAANAIKAAKSTPSAQAIRQTQLSDRKAAELQNLKKKMGKGMMTPEEHTRMFNHLVD